MAIKVLGQITVENNFQLRSINGYDSTVVTHMTESIKNQNNTFTVYNSAGTAIKTVYFAS